MANRRRGLFPYGTFHLARQISAATPLIALSMPLRVTQWMCMLAIQFIALAELHAQPSSAQWNIHPTLAGVDYSNYSSVARRTARLAEASDGTVCYRIAKADSRIELTTEEQA